ncbi:MAG: heat-inducible transcription repressor HrcA [Elusimicrobia bacterium]|nr:heat-inducible transcription repressor HrcA [Elusimicrobiota bacterium]
MRQLAPRVVEERKKRLLQWVVHRYIKTSVPIPSQTISEEAGLNLSSASIRSLLHELEREGLLHQPHTSAGRVPTDKGYRYYVDYLMEVQRLATEEKEGLERQYSRRVEELDHLLSETSKLLAHSSRSAGLVLSPKMEKQSLRRLEILPIGGSQVLVVVVTQAGLIRHWPIKLSRTPTASQLQRLNRFLNDNIQSKSIREVKAAIQAKIEAAERELHDLEDFARRLLDGIVCFDPPGELYMEGTAHILARPEELGDFKEVQSLIRLIDEKRTLGEVLEREIESRRGALEAESRMPVQVRIGRENALPGLRNVSLVTTTYSYGDQVVGVLGILGPKRMEYSKMIGLVDLVSEMVSKTLKSFSLE